MKDYFKCETGTWKYVPNWPRNIKYNLKWIKWFFQRGARGWADCDVWSIDGYLNVIMPDMITRLQEIQHGSPALDKDGNELTEEQWKIILEKIKLGFLSASTLANIPESKEEQEISQQRFDEGLTLFKLYYFDLWD